VKTEEELVKGALEIFHKMKEHFDNKEFNRQVIELFKSVEKTPLQKMIAFSDMNDVLRHMPIWVDKPLKEINDAEFIGQFRSRILSTKTYDFYVPIYCLYGFPKDVKLGFSTVIDFQDLPPEVSSDFIMLWEHRFTCETELQSTKEAYVNLKKRSTFIHFSVDANGNDKAIEKAKLLAEDSLHIIRFLYQINFNIVDLRYKVREREESGGLDEIAGLPFLGWAKYNAFVETHSQILTGIFIKTNPNEIERKIKNAVRIYGIQTSVTNEQVRFVLLVTCLESLLMTGSDKDYILWRLAEKAAFVIGRNKLKINNMIKEAYGKRSAFVHGTTKEDELVTENDIFETEGLVVNLVWKLVFEFLKNGYASIQKTENAKSIDEYVLETKFGKA
jgi:hypothetical protein